MKKIFILLSILLASMLTSAAALAINTDSNVNTGWVDVPTTDTQPFDTNCEYRVFQSTFGPASSVLYSNAVLSNWLVFRGVDGPNAVVILKYSNKGMTNLAQNNGKWATDPAPNYFAVDKLQKLCRTSHDLTNMFAVFLSTGCPEGWSRVTDINLPISCNTDNCLISFCRKN